MANSFYDITNPRETTLARAAERLQYDSTSVSAYAHAIESNNFFAWLAVTQPYSNSGIHKSEEVTRSRDARLRKVPVHFLPDGLMSLHNLKVVHSER